MGELSVLAGLAVLVVILMFALTHSMDQRDTKKRAEDTAECKERPCPQGGVRIFINYPRHCFCAVSE